MSREWVDMREKGKDDETEERGREGEEGERGRKGRVRKWSVCEAEGRAPVTSMVCETRS